MENLIKLREALNDFERAFFNLQITFREFEEKDGIELDHIIKKDYPFKNSFDELNIEKWVNSSCEEINNLLTGTFPPIVDRHSLTVHVLNKLRVDTGHDWKDSSFCNDLTDSVALNLKGDYSIKIFLPNSVNDDESKEEINKYLVEIWKEGEILNDSCYPLTSEYKDLLAIVKTCLSLIH